MASETATIRVSRRTRNLLAEQARRRGMSLSEMLAELARDAEREAIFHDERDATRTDAGDPSVRREETYWETADGDGVE